jgi:serine/threonine protein kinase
MPAMPAVAILPDSGRRIGRYQPIRRLAVGGMAEIYLARLPGVGIEGFEKLVVLKRILPQHALDPELLRMFLDEARLSATLTHPHITEVYDVGTDGEAPFFAMEYVHGANLREIQRAFSKRGTLKGSPNPPAMSPAGRSPSGSHAIEGATGPASRSASGPHAITAVPLPLAQAVGIVAAAAAGLHYAHERLGPGGEPLDIVHRDVSPSNVLVSYDGAVKVSDFGIAKWAYQRTRTQEGTLKGKFAYMSPEQCRGRAVDRRSDVFALGAILHEMTTGAAPFSGASDLEILNQIATGSAAPPVWAEGAGRYPPALSAIVMRALAPDPADRFPTMQALQVALESFARDEGLALSTVALASFVQELFADELTAWHAAQREGKSLAEHLAARPSAAQPIDSEDRTATDAFGPTRRRARARARWGRSFAVAASVVLAAFAGGFLTKKWKGESSRPPAAARAAEVAAPTTRAPPPPAAPPSAPSPLPAFAARPTAATPAKPGTPGTAMRPKGRGRARAATPGPAPRPSLESRLGAWDPDSPVPP